MLTESATLLYKYIDYLLLTYALLAYFWSCLGTVHHGIILEKANHYGIQGVASYLLDSH